MPRSAIRTSTLAIGAVLILALTLLLGSNTPQPVDAQIHPTSQQQTLDAMVAQMFAQAQTATAQAAGGAAVSTATPIPAEAIAEGAVIVVNSLADDPRGCPRTCTLRSAIATAQPGDTIVFEQSLAGTIVLSQTLTIDKPLTVNGSSADAVTVESSGQFDSIVIPEFVTVSISNLAFNDSEDTSGYEIIGAIRNFGTLTLTNVAFSGATLVNDRGNYSSILDAAGISFTDNQSSLALYNLGTATIRDSVFSDNSGTRGLDYLHYATLIYNGSVLELTEVTIDNNTAESPLIASLRTLSIQNSVIANNRSSAVISLEQSDVSIDSSTFTDNQAVAVLGSDGGNIVVRNSTFTGHTDEAISGNGVITNSTIALNPGGGISTGQYNRGTLALSSSIVAGNGEFDVSGAITSLGNNLIGSPGDTTGWFSSDILNADPLLAPLGDYGGTTQTMALYDNSPAIGAGYCVGDADIPAVTTDQRGVVRKDPCDIGAYEREEGVALVVPTAAPTSSAALPTVTPISTPRIIVNSLADDVRGCPDQCPLRQALSLAESGDIIGFEPSLSGTIVLAQPLVIDKDITIVGPDSNAVSIDGGGAVALLSISGDIMVSISHLNLNNGYSDGDGNYIAEAGAINNLGNLTLANVTMRGNTGEGAIVNSGSLSVIDSTFTSNVGNVSGGAISNTGTLTVTNSMFDENRSYGSGAISSEGNLTITGTSFRNNSNIADIGGVGAIYASGEIHVEDSIFDGNSCAGSGGALYLESQSASIIRTTFSLNSAGTSGGAVYAVGNVEFVEVTFSRNRSSDGGALILGGGQFVIDRTTFVENSALDNGGAVFSRGVTRITNSTFADNTAGEEGGALLLLGEENSLYSSTIVDNEAATGGGIANSGTLTIRSSIVSGNRAASGPDVNGQVNSLTGNLIGNTQGSTGWFASDQQNVDPLVAPLGDYGGVTQTIALSEGSPAIGMGYCDAEPVIDIDQRGTARNTPCDTGAFDTADGLGIPLASESEMPMGVIIFDTTENVSPDDFEGSNIGIVSTDGSDRRLIISDGESQQPVASSDGASFAFVAGVRRDGFRYYTISISDINGSEIHQALNEVVSRVAGLDWSPDATMLFFSTRGGYLNDLYSFNLATQTITALTETDGSELYPQVSPDGTRIIFVAEPGDDPYTESQETFDLFTMDIQGTNIVRLTEDVFFDTQPSWSPDGSRVAFISNRQGINDVYIMNSDGTEIRRVTNELYGAASPSWSPDGEWLAYVCTTATMDSTQLNYPFVFGARSNDEICLVKTDGTNRIQLTSNEVYDGNPRWMPDISMLPVDNDTSPSAGAIVCPVHIVIAGDSIGSIAEQYGADMFEVMAANNLDENSAALLQIGQTLIIPVEGCVVENSPLISTETPSSGQNSSGIAFDSAITLDGVNDYVESPSQSILDVSAFTVELWVYPTAIQDGYQPLVVRDLTEEFQRSFGLYIEPNSLYTHFSFSSDCTWYYYYTSNTPLPIETWTHVSMTYDGTNFTLYYNGEVDRQVQVSGQVCQPDAPLSIGHTYGDFPKANFGGRLAEVRIWDYARTQSEISASMNVTLTGTEAGLVALYPLTDTDDGSAEELVIGNNGVVHR